MPTLAQNEERIATNLLKLTANREKELLRAYRVAYKDTVDELAVLYRRHAKEGKLTYGEMSRYNRLKNLEEDIRDNVRGAYKPIRTLPADAYQAAYYQYGWAIEQEAGFGLRFGLLNQPAVQRAIQLPISGLTLTETLQKNRSNLLRSLRQNITQGLIRGDSYPKMARNVRSIFEGDAKKSMRVVRTEGHRASVLGQMDAYDKAEDAGVDIERIWDATLDSRTRPQAGRPLTGPNHRRMDGKIQDPGKGWFLPDKGVWVLAPGNTGFADHDISCRCRARAQVKGYAPEQRRIRGEGIRDYVTFEDWAKEKGIAA